MWRSFLDRKLLEGRGKSYPMLTPANVQCSFSHGTYSLSVGINSFSLQSLISAEGEEGWSGFV